jgi:hypothetical protein
VSVVKESQQRWRWARRAEERGVELRARRSGTSGTALPVETSTWVADDAGTSRQRGAADSRSGSKELLTAVLGGGDGDSQREGNGGALVTVKGR